MDTIWECGWPGGYLNKYRFIFEGRKVGSIGVLNLFSVIVKAHDPVEGRLKLYDEYEHITIKTITKINKYNEVRIQ